MSTFDERLVVNDHAKQNLIYNEHLARYLLASQLVRGKKVLDIACGSGYGSKLLADAGAEKVLAIDISQEAIDLAKKNYPHDRIEYIIDSAEKLEKVQDKSIDIAVSFETIEHLQNYTDFLQALARVAGTAVISTPNKSVFNEENPYHVKEFTKQEFESELKKYFQNVRILEQKNSLASHIMTNSQNQLVRADENGKPLYFIAICSNHADIGLNSVVSLNTKALERWQSNPGLRLINWIYKILAKLKLVG
ncbi:MAG: class I SAM-dependent methyltransferase [bacterium]